MLVQRPRRREKPMTERIAAFRIAPAWSGHAGEMPASSQAAAGLRKLQWALRSPCFPALRTPMIASAAVTLRDGRGGFPRCGGRRAWHKVRGEGDYVSTCIARTIRTGPSACPVRSPHPPRRCGDNRLAIQRPPLPGKRRSSSSAAAIPMPKCSAETERLAARLHALGVRKGDRVLLDMQNCPQFVIAQFAHPACQRGGGAGQSDEPGGGAEALHHSIRRRESRSPPARSAAGRQGRAPAALKASACRRT